MQRATQSVLQRVRRLKERMRAPITGPLVIVDDVFPNLVSGFRIGEFNAYLREFPDAVVASTPHWWPTTEGEIGFQSSKVQYSATYPELADRVQELLPHRRVRAGLVYCLFLNNALSLVDGLERTGQSFLFTLYPGGGLQLGDPVVDSKLSRVLNSSSCRGVITTQRTTRDYVIERQMVDTTRITHVFGGVAPETSRPSLDRPRYGRNKRALDVAFAANRYLPDGRDKGYDLFLAAARLAAAQREELQFHVVGGHGPRDLPLDGLETRITFHGPLPALELESFFARCDVIVSPNRPFVLAPGAFDGFPTGTCVLAGLAGAAVIATDELSENVFVDGRDIVVVRPDAEEVALHLVRLAGDPDEVARLGESARSAFQHTYSFESQMTPRIELLRSHLEGTPT